MSLTKRKPGGWHKAALWIHYVETAFKTSSYERRPGFRSGGTAPELHARRRGAGHDPGGRELSDQDARGPYRRASVRPPAQASHTDREGPAASPAVTEAFAALRAAFAGIEEAAQSVLSITTLTTFAANWLIPRLGKFQQLHPNIAVQISVSSHVEDFIQSEFDIAIRSGNGDWAGLEAHLLFPNLFTPV